MAALSLSFFLPTGIWGMVLALFCIGFPVGPTLVSMFTVAGNLAPKRRLGTVMTILASGLVAGTALGNALSGVLAVSGGYRGAFLIPMCAGLAMFVCAGASWLLTRVPRNASW